MFLETTFCCLFFSGRINTLFKVFEPSSPIGYSYPKPEDGDLPVAGIYKGWLARLFKANNLLKEILGVI